jgi:hypothetical protein
VAPPPLLLVVVVLLLLSMLHLYLHLLLSLHPRLQGRGAERSPPPSLPRTLTLRRFVAR